jgi:hypothetical protein
LGFRNLQEKLEKYNERQSKYINMFRNKKKSSWRKLMTDNEDIYRLDKILQRQESKNMAMMEGCTTGEESNDRVINHMFPGNILMEDHVL